MKIKKLVALLLAVAMVASVLAACGSKTPAPSNSPEPSQSVEPSAEPSNEPTAEPLKDVSDMSYDERSTYLYNEALGEFMALYEAAKDETEDLGLRYALMAQAEAKLLASGAFLPLSTKGGNYAVSRVAARTASSTLWGNDSYRFHNVVVADKFITAAERAEIKAKWAELAGTGTFEQWVKDYLTGKGYSLKDTYNMIYSSDPQTWDALATSRAADSEAIVNTYDGLYEYDMENVLQPALALSHEVKENADGTVTYTFKLREGVQWVDAQGRKVAEVTADDFVAGLQHMMDSMGGLEYLIEGIIVNASEYMYEGADMSTVGVKAVDNYTLEYTLTGTCPYFLTMLSYNVFAPMNRAYYQSQGGKFGAEYDSEAATYNYGKTPNNIAYCGPYTVTNATAENTIVFQANPAYWNKDNINMKTITWLFNDGSEATKSYKDAVAGTIDGAGLNAAALEACKADGLFDEYAYVSDTDATSFCAFFNLYRERYANFNDETTVVSTMTEADGARTNLAMRNQHFRLALCLAADRASYNAQTVGEALKLNSLRNTYTPGNFVTLPNEATVTINGQSVTYPAGTFYGEIMQAQMDADNIPVKVWDAENSTSDSYDGWFNPSAAAAELDKAIAELAASGVEISAANPIQVDLPAYAGSEVYLNRANVFKQSIESALGGKVVVNLVQCVDAKQWYYAGYYTDYGYDANYNIYDVSGWGPDYGDPQTYLDTMLPDYAGYMAKCLGVF
ncbi:MAG: ABC transporter substrate-binding protein [Oscillospiraceae bacterium]|nr:ABC transporter substrate-binding protein [Oscillospiraceae bacterium]